MRGLPRILKWAATGMFAALGLAASGLFYAWYAWEEGPFGVSNFDQAQWMAAPHRSYRTEYERETACERAGMVRDLQRRYLRPGMTREQVVALLGAPDGAPQEGCIAYVLGMCSGFGIDYDDLRICFTPDGGLIKSLTVQN